MATIESLEETVARTEANVAIVRGVVTGLRADVVALRELVAQQAGDDALIEAIDGFQIRLDTADADMDAAVAEPVVEPPPAPTE